MPPRLFVDTPLRADAALSLPPGPTRHVQVLRLQPGAALTLFDGTGGEWDATVERMGRSEVSVRLGAHRAVERELGFPVVIALGMPANERMDGVVEKATELGVSAIQPLQCERSVLRLGGDRADKKVAHWQAVALGACEQSGRTRVPVVAPVRALGDWLRGLGEGGPARWMLSFDASRPFSQMAPEKVPPVQGVLSLSGPEGGLTPAEEALARATGFLSVSLGARVLRADTAPLALLAALSLGDD